MKPKVIIVQRIFASYKKPFFDRLAMKTDFRLLHGRNQSGINQVKAPYCQEIDIFQYGVKDTQVLLFFIRQLFSFKPDVVIHEATLGILSTPIMLILCKLMGIKFVLWGHGYNRKKGFHPKKSPSSFFRLLLMKMADGYLLYGFETKRELSLYLPKNKLFVSPNTLDTDALGEIKRKLDLEGKEAVKQRLGLHKKFNLIFIGRLLAEKLPDVAILAINQLKATFGNEIALHFVGSGPLEPLLKKMVNEAGLEQDVFFHGAIFEDEIVGSYLYASDLTIMPGLMGLAINHSFCFGIPVITYQGGPLGPYHSPEIEYVIHGKSGFICKNFDLEDLTQTIVSYLNNDALQTEAKTYIEKLLVEKMDINLMVSGGMECINTVLNGKA